jgi:hypothetical protein
MASSVNILRVFVAAPGDIRAERDTIEAIVEDWNTHRGHSALTRLEMVWWRNSARPEMGNRPQALINDQVLDDADFVVGVFWSRFGTPTGVADSGTEEEIRRSISAGKPVMLYFSTRDIPQANLDADQFGKVQAFKREMAGAGLYWEYGDLDEFREEFKRHLASTMEDILRRNENGVPVSPARPSRETPLEEVKVPGVGSTSAAPLAGIDIPMPSMTAAITDRDRAKFIRSALPTIQSYFEKGLKQLQSLTPGIEFDLEQVTAAQFACRIYVNGSEAAGCKIWRSDSMGSPSIHYSTEDILSTHSNSYNEWLSVNKDELRLSAHMVTFGTPDGIDATNMSPEEAAQYLWLKVTEHLSIQA